MSEEIRFQIEELNRQLENEMDPTTFVLNPAAALIFKKIEALQERCQHSFENKECKYCGRREEDV